MDKQLDIRFRFQPLCSTPDGILLHYIKNQIAPITHEMVLKPLRAYWLAEAYLHCGRKKNQELKKLAQHMIFALEEQANYLRTVFGIEREAIYHQVSAQMQIQSSRAAGSFPQPEEEEESNAWASVLEIDMDGL